jgi:ABC-2 type transport system ATP-binding protein
VTGVPTADREATDMPVIEVEGLQKSYGDVEAVRGVDFRVEEGEVFALLGPNGAGKTTIVEILEGYRRPSAGTVSVLGIDPQSASRALKERVGIVLQSAGVYPELTVREAVALHARYYPHPRPVDEVVELVGLAEKRSARIKKLSGGQQRRVDLALGIVGDPDLVFLDEPTTGFDPSARRKAWGIVKGLCSLGKTVLLTTHYMDEAQHLADRLAIISAGRIIAEGTPDDLGGRDHATPLVTFRLPPGLGPADLPDEVRQLADASTADVRISAADPTRVLYHLTGWALERRVDLHGLALHRPSLEDVYLDLVGEVVTTDA